MCSVVSYGLVAIQRTDSPLACAANHYLDGAPSRQQVLLEPDEWKRSSPVLSEAAHNARSSHQLLSRLLASIAQPALDEHFTRSCDRHLAVGLAQLIAAARAGSAGA